MSPPESAPAVYDTWELYLTLYSQIFTDETQFLYYYHLLRQGYYLCLLLYLFSTTFVKYRYRNAPSSAIEGISFTVDM